MQSPPPFAPSGPPPKKTNVVLIVVLVLLGVGVLCCAGVVGVGYWGFKKVGGFTSCTMNYLATRQALKDYADAHKGKLPGAAHWQDDIIPYYPSEMKKKELGGGIIKIGDPAQDLGCAADDTGPATGMAFNKDLAGKTLDEVRKYPSTVVLFEVAKTGRNLSLPYKVQPGEPPQKMMGQPRPWLTITAEGSINNQASFGQSGKYSGF